VGPATGVPQSAQNLARADNVAPQEEQVAGVNEAPHSEQNLPEVIAPQAGHFWVAGVIRES
jgi:hypothetical protein